MATATATGKRSSIFGIPVAYLAVWAAIYGVAAILPAIPLVGGGTFGGQEFILSLAGILFGPWAGAVAASVGGILASFIGPATAYFGLATFYPHAIGALVAGLLMLNTRNSRLAVLAIFAVGMIAFGYVPPFSKIGTYIYAKGANWPLHLTALIGLWFSPWAVRQIKTYDVSRMWMGIAVISWTTYMVNHVWLNLGWAFLFPAGPESWVFAFWSGIVPAQRIILTVASVVIGTGLVIGLYRAGVRFPQGTGSALEEDQEEDL